MEQQRRQRNERGEGGRLREEIVVAATDLVDRDGPGALTLRGVGRATGVAAPSIYRHFADIDAVTDAVLAASFAELHDVVSSAIADQADPEAALVAGCTAYVRFGWEHRHRFQLMFSESGYAPDAVATFDAVRGAIDKCVASGTSASSDAHADAFLLWVAMHGLAILQKPSRADLRRLGPLDRDGAIDTLVGRLARLV